MFNPFTYQGATATIDGQPASLNGQSRIPEYLASGLNQVTSGIGYNQGYGYPTGYPVMNAQTMINPITGTPVTTPVGIPNPVGVGTPTPNFATVNPVCGVSTVGYGINTPATYPTFVNGQPVVTTTPWGATFPNVPNFYNPVPPTVFGIPAVQPFFGLGLTFNPYTGVMQPTIGGFAGQFPWAVNTPFANPFATPVVNPWINPWTAQSFANATICGIPTATPGAWVGGCGPVCNIPGIPNAFGVNPVSAALSPFGTINPMTTGIPGVINTYPNFGTSVTTPYMNTFANRFYGVNPYINQFAGGCNPVTGFNSWNPLVNNFTGTNYPFFSGINQWGYNATPWAGTNFVQNPWVGSPCNPFASTFFNPVGGWNTGVTSYGQNAGSWYPGVGAFCGTQQTCPTLWNSTGCWPTCGI